MSSPTRARSAAATVTVTVRYFAGAKAAAGVREEVVEVPAGSPVADLVVSLAADHGDALARVLAASSLLVDEVAVADRAAPLPDGATVDVLPPFAGG